MAQMNTKSSTIAAGWALAIALLATGNASAYAPPSSEISVLGLARDYAAVTPLSMQYFCASHRSECAASGSSQVRMTDNLMAVLMQVNSRVNRAITPTRDTNDVWSLNPTRGDCEDYVLSKRSALVRNGVPAGALRIAYTHTRQGAPHAVLVVKTSQGDYVLDNLSGSVKTLRASGYNIRSMSSPDPTRWTAG